MTRSSSDSAGRPRFSAYQRAFSSAQLSRAAQTRIKARMLEAAERPLPHGGPGLVRLWLPVGVAVALAGVLLLGWRALLSGGCDVEAAAGGTRYSGACRVALPHLAVQMGSGARLGKAGERIALLGGRARFEVEPVPPGGAPVSLWVPAGRIDVLGTVFEVRVRPQEGSIVLHEGSIRFTGPGGQRLLSAGEELEWVIPQDHPSGDWREQLRQAAEPQLQHAQPVPQGARRGDPPGDVAGARPDSLLPGSGQLAGSRDGPGRGLGIPPRTQHLVESATSTVPPEPAARAPVSKGGPPSGRVGPRAPRGSAIAPFPSGAPPSAQLPSGASPSGASSASQRGMTGVQEVLQLKSRGRYSEALSVLDTVRKRGGSRHAHEVLSFERALLLERINPQSACRQFERHLREFPGGRYHQAAQRRSARCRGAPEPAEEPAFGSGGSQGVTR